MTPIEKEIEGIVDGILEDYRHGRDIDKLDPFQHPDKAVVIDMIGKLLRIVYPRLGSGTLALAPHRRGLPSG